MAKYIARIERRDEITGREVHLKLVRDEDVVRASVEVGDLTWPPDEGPTFILSDRPGLLRCATQGAAPAKEGADVAAGRHRRRSLASSYRENGRCGDALARGLPSPA